MGAAALAAMAQSQRAQRAVILKGNITTQALAGIHTRPFFNYGDRLTNLDVAHNTCPVDQATMPKMALERYHLFYHYKQAGYGHLLM